MPIHKTNLRPAKSCFLRWLVACDGRSKLGFVYTSNQSVP